MLNLIVITGGPGSGKSTLVTALAEAGMMVVEEAGRAVIREVLASGGDALPWVNPMAFAERMLERDIANYDRFAGSPEPIFFDRGIPDVLGYLDLSGLSVPEHMRETAHARRYNPVVFIAPHWPAIYTQDAERKQDEDEAMRTFEAMQRIYGKLGYELRELPKANVEDRVRFVLDTLGRG